METITHNLFAVIIQILCFKFVFFPLNIILTIFLAFISHIFTDAIGIITYHTPEIQKDKFWLIWHVIIYTLSIVSILIFMIPFWFSMLMGNIMDLWDWCILRPIQNRKRKIIPETNWGEKYYFHRIVDATRNKLFYWLPKWNYKKGGILIEILIIVVLAIIIIFFLI
ncbi:MAG: hypothetical protein KGD65_06265 [Candidatus Lokiarchaeota archaeon]|nr:hypothetical protein [Candidatus Lokiarchaeota archaeon]